MVTFKEISFAFAAAFIYGSILLSCAPPTGTGGTSSTTVTTTIGDAIYISSGTIYPGLGITASPPSNIISRYNTAGVFQAVVRDYTLSPGDTPAGMVNYDTDNLLVLVENASGRRLELVPKNGDDASLYLTNSTALSAQVRAIVAAGDGGFLVSKSTAIEKFNSSKSRVLNGANPFISAPTGVCATTATLITSIAIGASNTIFMSHAAATTNNQFNLISSTGFSGGAGCLASQDGPSVNAYPTSMLYHTSGKLLVSYSNNTGPVHQINSYTVTATTIGATTVATQDSSIIQGVTTMAQTPDGDVLVASGAPAFNTIEKFTFNSTAGTLTRSGTTAFITPSVYTRSVSAIVYDDQ